MYSCEDVISYVEEENVKFIRLAFVDTAGRQKNVTIMPGELRRAFDQGIAFDASAIPCFGDEASSDLFLVPEPSTLSEVPWHALNGRMVRMYCSIRRSDGTPFPLDSRALLCRAVAAAAREGITCRFGAEFEFYLFKTDAQGERTEIPFDSAGYMDIDPGDKCETVRREICFTLLDMGITPECAHHEEGPGQNEIDFRYSDALTAADNAVTFKSVVRTVAARNGLYASFYPKPLPGHPGNGMHINLSLLCARGGDATPAFMAGIMEHIGELTFLLNPTEESYRRLGEMKAPRHISWSAENRSQLIRIPAARDQTRRIELRSPDPGANPYLAFAALIYAGLDGVKRGLVPPAPVNINLFKAEAEALRGIPTLPASYAEAAAQAAASPWLPTVLPELAAIL